MSRFVITHQPASLDSDSEVLVRFLSSLDALYLTSSTWLIRTEKSAKEVVALLRQYIPLADRLFVLPLAG